MIFFFAFANMGPYDSKHFKTLLLPLGVMHGFILVIKRNITRKLSETDGNLGFSDASKSYMECLSIGVAMGYVASRVFVKNWHDLTFV